MAKKKAKTKAKTKSRKKARARGGVPAKRTKRGAKKTKRAAKSAPKTKKAKAAKPKARTASAAAPAPRSLPAIEVQTTNGGRVNLADLKGRNVVIYFYPKDDTPGCTTEGCDIRDHYGDFQQHDTIVYGVSRDGVDSHERFKAKFNFPFELIADPDEKLCRAFGVIQQKSLYGRTYMGVDRSTFIYDKAGMLRKEFRGVKVPGHVDQLIEEIRKL